MGTKFLKIGNVDILVAYQGQFGPKQPNLKSVPESEVPLPAERPVVRKVKKLSKMLTLEFFNKFQGQYGFSLLNCHTISSSHTSKKNIQPFSPKTKIEKSFAKVRFEPRPACPERRWNSARPQ